MSGQRDSVSLHAMKKTLLLLLLLSLSLPLPLYATTVTGNLRDVGLSSLTKNVVIRFTLVNYGSNIPRVVGTNVIADAVVATDTTVSKAVAVDWFMYKVTGLTRF